MTWNRYITTTELAEILGISSHHLREVVKDRKRPRHRRKYSAKTHARVPRCVHKQGARYVAWGAALKQAIEGDAR